MLKRQRQASPPPSVSEFPAVYSLPSDSSSLDHIAKRRRTAGPGLDGRKRGMVHTESDETEGGFSDEEDNHLAGESSAEDKGTKGWQDDAGQYKDVNQLLHQLHFEQQRRSTFATSSVITSSSHSHYTRLQRDSSSHASKYHLHPPISSSAEFEGETSKSPLAQSDDAEQVWSTYEANNR